MLLGVWRAVVVEGKDDRQNDHGPLFLRGPRREMGKSATAAVDGVVKLNGRHLAWIPLHQMMLLSTGGAIKAFRQQSLCIQKTRGFYSFSISHRRVQTKCKKLKVSCIKYVLG